MPSLSRPENHGLSLAGHENDKFLHSVIQLEGNGELSVFLECMGEKYSKFSLALDLILLSLTLNIP